MKYSPYRLSPGFGNSARVLDTIVVSISERPRTILTASLDKEPLIRPELGQAEHERLSQPLWHLRNLYVGTALSPLVLAVSLAVSAIDPGRVEDFVDGARRSCLEIDKELPEEHVRDMLELTTPRNSLTGQPH